MEYIVVFLIIAFLIRKYVKRAMCQHHHPNWVSYNSDTLMTKWKCWRCGTIFYEDPAGRRHSKEGDPV